MYPYNVEDKSFAKVKRFIIRVRVDAPMSEEELRQQSEEIILEETRLRAVNAIGLFFYLPATNIFDGDGKLLSLQQMAQLKDKVVHVAGVVDWAPEGDWARANQVRSGDYSRHQYKINAGVTQPV